MSLQVSLCTTFLATALSVPANAEGPWIVKAADQNNAVEKLKVANDKPEATNINALLEELEAELQKGSAGVSGEGEARLFVGAGTTLSVFMIHYEEEAQAAEQTDDAAPAEEEEQAEYAGRDQRPKRATKCTPEVRVVEVPRRERGESDLVTLLQLAPYIPGRGLYGASDEPLQACKWDDARTRVTGLGYVTKKERADVRFRGGFNLTASDGDTEVAGRAPSFSSDYLIIMDLRHVQRAGSGEVISRVITGSRESFFISADAIVADTDVLKFDRTTQALQVQKPPQFLIGLNFSFGDMVGDPRSFADRVFTKLMLAASDEPTSHFGFGLGIRGSGLGGDVVDLSPLTLFAGYMWVEEDELTPEGTARIGSRREGDWQFGLGFDLARAFEWLKSE